MSVNDLGPGKKIPDEFNVVIEIPKNGAPVKYEVDKDTGALVVDRFMATCMYYPCNYGYVPQSLALDDDPVDVLVITPAPLMSGSAIPCRPIGLLQMTDEAGEDAKVLAVPTEKLAQQYAHIQSIHDITDAFKASVKHFFEHYKDLEEGKWVRVDNWEDKEAARQEIESSVQRYQQNH